MSCFFKITIHVVTLNPSKKFAGYEIIASKYFPEFGLSIDNKMLIFNYFGLLPHKIITKITWQNSK